MLTLLPLLLAPPKVLIVGGGPNKEYNQVAIESNVRYFARILPKEWPYRLLFADGTTTAETVRYTPAGETDPRKDKYRAPDLPQLNGPSRPDEVVKEVSAIATAQPASVLLYFTGHGSIARDIRPATSQFDLWGNSRVAVPALAKSLSGIPNNVPVTVLMVQCHSGGFAKLLFTDGDPTKPPIDNRLCGFYASTEQRYAAGCTSAINEADYKDFTSYFVAALTGEDRLGKKWTGQADYDHNGKIGMNEAYCWSLVNDESIDTPVCTSDEFLRDVLNVEDKDIFSAKYSDVLKWATKAQRAALEGLSSILKLEGEDRLSTSYTKYLRLDDDEEDLTPIRGYRFIRLAKSVVLAHQMAKFPDRAVKKRFETLLADEAQNPLRP